MLDGERVLIPDWFPLAGRVAATDVVHPAILGYWFPKHPSDDAAIAIQSRYKRSIGAIAARV